MTIFVTIKFIQLDFKVMNLGNRLKNKWLKCPNEAGTALV